MSNETKGFTVDIKVGTGDLKANEFEAIMSAPTLDRDNEIVDSLAFAPLPDKITVDIDHAMSVRSLVGSGRPFYDPQGLLKIRGQFASTALAQEVRTLAKEGHLDRMSITFQNAIRSIADDGLQHVTKGELLNVAFVVIPANREAAVIGAKGLTEAETRQIHGLPEITPVEVRDADTVELTVADALDQIGLLRADVDALAATVAALVTKSPTSEAPEGAPDDLAADEAASREAAARQRSAVAQTARAYLARGPQPTR